MERTKATGFRTPGAAVLRLEQRDIDKDKMWEAGRYAAEIYRLPSNWLTLIEKLIGFYQHNAVDGRILVWPSNEAIGERTRLAERSIRHALSGLIELGLITTKESANGKRYARKSPSGQIIDAFGIDLTPLLVRLTELRDRMAALVDQKRAQSVMRGEVTICRRTCQAWLIAAPSEALEAEYDRLTRSIPRRDSKQPIDPVLADWRAFMADVEAHYIAACAGNDRRHKEPNKDGPDQSCYNGQGIMEQAKPPEEEVSLHDLRHVCRDAINFTGPFRDLQQLIEIASANRGWAGVSQDAWVEACTSIGRLGAATALMLMLQKKTQAAKGDKPIRNPGGYFRFIVRGVATGTYSLTGEISAMKRRR